MKKVFLLTAISLVFCAASHAQIRLGALFGYGSEVEQPGLGVNAEFMLNDKMAISPNLLFYFPEKFTGGKYSYWELNGNFNYYFFDKDAIAVYGLAGLNVTTIKVKYDNNSFFASASDSEFGLNIGGGVNFNAGGIIPFSEVKYTLSDFDQLVLILGIKFPLGGK
ncbi:MAG: outer membrane beta-barrel protein [Bacteroidota bacterium]